MTCVESSKSEYLILRMREHLEECGGFIDKGNLITSCCCQIYMACVENSRDGRTIWRKVETGFGLKCED